MRAKPQTLKGVGGCETANPKRVRVFFFLLWPLFARAPRHGFLENFLLSARVCKVFFFLLRSVGRLGGARAKKKTPPRVFFFLLRPRGKAGEGEAPLGAGTGRRHGARAKKKTPPRFFFLLRPRGKAGEGEASLGAGTGPEQKKKHHPGCFFLLWPWAPARGQSKIQKNPGCFFFAPAPGKGRGRRSPVGRRHGARAKTQGVFFFCSGPGERQGKEKRRWAPARGQSKKINTTQGVCFFYCGRRQGKEKLRWAPARGQSKKKNTIQGVFFLAPAPGKAGEGEAPLRAGTGPEQNKKTRVFLFLLRPWAPARGQSKKKNTTQGVFFFLLRPRGKAGEGEASLGAGTGPEQKKNTTQGVFLCSGPGERQGKEKLRWAPARGQSKKKTPPRVFFFLLRCGPARTLTHSLRAWVVLPLAGVVFFFFAAAPPGRGDVFFFAVAPPRRSLTHFGLGRFRQGRMVFFFLLWPRRVFFG